VTAPEWGLRLGRLETAKPRPTRVYLKSEM
jgi:hypothetical protein